MTNQILKQKNKESFLEALKSKGAFGSISLAASKMGVSRQSIYNWRREDFYFDEAVIDAIKEGKIRIADIAEQALIRRLNDGDITAIIFTLKTLRSNHYGDKEERQTAEKRLAEKSNEQGQPRSPLEALLILNLTARHHRYIAEKAKVLTPEIAALYDKIETAIKEQEAMLR